MQLHHLKRSHIQRKARRVGRGGKRGTFSGRGTKGLLARAGGKRRPEERDTVKRIPKLRGYRFHSLREQPAIVHIDRLEKIFASGDVVSPESLIKSGLVKKSAGRMPRIKILSRGTVSQQTVMKKFIFRGVTFSQSIAERYV